MSAHFSALDDEEFFVVEGSRGGGVAGSLLPGVLPLQLSAAYSGTVAGHPSLLSGVLT